MDCHFITPKEEIKLKKSTSKVGNLLFKLIPVFILSAMLPLFILFVSQPSDLRFLTKASQNNEIRIWFDPANTVVSPNRPVKIKIYALFESNLLVPSISLDLVSNGLTISNSHINYNQPFTGQVVLGEFTVQSDKSGEYVLEVNKDSIDLIAFDKPVDIITSSAKIKVK